MKECDNGVGAGFLSEPYEFYEAKMPNRWQLEQTVSDFFLLKEVR